MSKLYKYLPFNIKVKTIYDKVAILHSVNNNGYVDLLFENNVDSTGNQVTPILRPFEDLLKYIPATEAAAKLLGVKEDEMLYPLSVYFIYMQRDKDYAFWIERDKETTKQFPYIFKENKYLAGYYSSGNRHFNKYLVSEFVNFSPKTYEKGLDILRALHFNLDFEEGEYIIKTD